MNPIIQKLGVLAAMLSAFLSASAYDFEVDGIYYNITNRTAKEVEVTSETDGRTASSYSGNIIVPSSVSFNNELQFTVTAIGDYAFFKCSELTSITLPNTVTTIGHEAFSYCNSLTTITLPNSLKTIEGYAFSYCNSLTTITLPNSVTTIGNAAFASCRSLTSITIPNSVSDIGFSAFSGCSALMNIAVDVDNQKYSSIDGILYDKSQTSLICCPGGKSGEVNIPSSVTTIGEYAFHHCEGLTTVTIPNTVTTIEDGAFSSCNGLTTVTIPSSVTTIGTNAFNSCESLTTVTIPSSVTIIGAYAFQDCKSLISVTSLAVTPPQCLYGVFKGINKQKCTLYVPVESIDAYTQAPEWEYFILVKEAEDAAGIDSVVADPSAEVEVFKLNGTRVPGPVENLPAGIYIVREGSTARKIIVR